MAGQLRRRAAVPSPPISPPRGSETRSDTAVKQPRCCRATTWAVQGHQNHPQQDLLATAQGPKLVRDSTQLATPSPVHNLRRYYSKRRIVHERRADSVACKCDGGLTIWKEEVVHADEPAHTGYLRSLRRRSLHFLVAADDELCLAGRRLAFASTLLPRNTGAHGAAGAASGPSLRHCAQLIGAFLTRHARTTACTRSHDPSAGRALEPSRGHAPPKRQSSGGASGCGAEVQRGKLLDELLDERESAQQDAQRKQESQRAGDRDRDDKMEQHPRVRALGFLITVGQA